jgi:hypothetical protein
MILSIVLGVIGTLIGLLIFYMRVISVVIDEMATVELNEISMRRHGLAIKVSKKLARHWPAIKSMDLLRWSAILSNLAMLLMLVLLLILGQLREYMANYAGPVLIVLFLLSSLSNGQKSLERYHKIKPYLPIIFPALVYHGLSKLGISNPTAASVFVFPGATFQETKVMAAVIAFILTFLLPYPLAKFDVWFSHFVFGGVLNFVQDIMRLGTKPSDAEEIALRKIAKESLAFSLRVILTILAIIVFLNTLPS